MHFLKMQYIFCKFFIVSQKKLCYNILIKTKGDFMDILHLTPRDDVQKILDKITRPTTIYLAEGEYRNKLWIKGDNIKIIGANRETTVIIWDDFARKPHSDGGEYNTFRTYTLCVTGNGCSLENLTVVNSNIDARKVGQCVALSVNAPLFYAKNIDLKSEQDTLFTSPFPDDLVVRYSGLTDDPAYYDGFIPKEQLYMEGASVQIYEKCRIYGTVDYIFGCAEAYFDDCQLISGHDKRGYGYVAAPAHGLKQKRGYAFINCNFVNGGAKEGSVYLARPWRDFGKCDFVNCTLGNHINPALYDKWNDTYRDHTARFAHGNLKSEKPVDPVIWGRQLTEDEQTEIIKNYHKARNMWDSMRAEIE